MAAHSLTARSFASHGPRQRAARPSVIAADWDGLQFKLIFAFCLAFYLVAAIAARRDPRFWRRPAPRRSAFLEAWEASGTTARIALTG